jgi:uncharacterized protein (DUF1499 family)
MLRLPLLPELPMSRLAVWSWRFALFALVVAVLSIIVVRTGLLEVMPALTTFGAALVFALLAVLSALLAFVVIWRQGLRGLGRAVGGLLLGLLLLAYPGYLGYRAYKLPVINDITTDPAHPPSFGKLASLRQPGTDAYPRKFAALQEKAYPDIAPLEFDASTRVAYHETLKLIEKRKWQVVDEMPPIGNRDGVIEAVARTLIMGFPDDVVIRVSPDGTGSRVDVRSASRYGLDDFGTNARRVLALLNDIDAAVSAAPPGQTVPLPETTAPPKQRPQHKPARKPKP